MPHATKSDPASPSSRWPVTREPTFTVKPGKTVDMTISFPILFRATSRGCLDEDGLLRDLLDQPRNFTDSFAHPRKGGAKSDHSAPSSDPRKTQCSIPPSQKLWSLLPPLLIFLQHLTGERVVAVCRACGTLLRRYTARVAEAIDNASHVREKSAKIRYALFYVIVRKPTHGRPRGRNRWWTAVCAALQLPSYLAPWKFGLLQKLESP